MATSIKITALSDIGNNIAPTTLVPVVNMTGTPETQKSTLQNLGNLILAGAGGANFVAVGAATTAGTVTTAAQPNITSVGTLTALSVTGNVNSGNINTGRVVATGNISASGANLGNSASANYFVGNGSFLTGITVAAANVSGLGNIATLTLNGNSQTWLAGNGVFANIAIPSVGNIAVINLDGNVSNVLTGNGTFVALPVINANTVVWSTAPVSNTSTGTAGQAAYDSGGNLFVCVATDTWAKFTGTTSW